MRTDKDELYKAAFLIIGIVDLGAAYTFFTSEQYFSALDTLCTFALPLSALALFMVPNTALARSRRWRPWAALFFAVSSFLLIYEVASFSNSVPMDAGVILRYALFGNLRYIGISALISIGAVYVAVNLPRRHSRAARLAAALVLLIAGTAASYYLMYALPGIKVGNTDELAYNYYAASILAKGGNPYTASMQPIIDRYGTTASALLNGTYEYAYGYPALSFLAYVPMVLFGFKPFMPFVALGMFLVIVSAFILYSKSDRRPLLLAPIFAWLVFAYYYSGFVNSYLSVSILLLLAYLWRGRRVASPLLLGLAASAIQLAWIALPFFFLLSYSEHGRKRALETIAVAALAYAAVNGAFIALSPAATLGNTTSLLGPNEPPFDGTNMLGVLTAFYAVPRWYSTFVSSLLMVSASVLYVLYGKTLKPVFALVPALIFFLSWRNTPTYGIPFIPLVLAAYYTKSSKARDLAKRKIYIAGVLLAVFVLALSVAVYAHGRYLSRPLLSINSIMPVVLAQSPVPGSTYGLGGILVNVTSNYPDTEYVSFFVLSRHPNQNGYVLGSKIAPIAPNAPYTYRLGVSSPAIGSNSTRIIVFALSREYIAAKSLDFDNLLQGR